MTNPENKDFWVEAGEYAEGIFLRKYGEKLGVAFNPAKTLFPNGKYHPDLWIPHESRYGDLKIQKTPFFTSSRYGLDPNSTVTFNVKDARRYFMKYPNLKIYFWVEWGKQEKMGIDVSPINGVWSAEFSQMAKWFIEKKCPEHHYQNREGDKRNARSSFLIDLNLLNREV